MAIKKIPFWLFKFSCFSRKLIYLSVYCSGASSTTSAGLAPLFPALNAQLVAGVIATSIRRPRGPASTLRQRLGEMRKHSYYQKCYRDRSGICMQIKRGFQGIMNFRRFWIEPFSHFHNVFRDPGFNL